MNFKNPLKKYLGPETKKIFMCPKPQFEFVLGIRNFKIIGPFLEKISCFTGIKRPERIETYLEEQWPLMILSKDPTWQNYIWTAMLKTKKKKYVGSIYFYDRLRDLKIICYFCDTLLYRCCLYWDSHDPNKNGGNIHYFDLHIESECTNDFLPEKKAA